MRLRAEREERLSAKDGWLTLTGLFWLEQGEHDISVDRIVLLGGHNASFLRPTISTVLWPSKKIDFTYRGNFAGIDLGKDPKYTENLFLMS